MSELNSTNAWPFTEIPAEEGLDINAIFGDSTDTANQGNPFEVQATAAAPAPAPATQEMPAAPAVEATAPMPAVAPPKEAPAPAQPETNATAGNPIAAAFEQKTAENAKKGLLEKPPVFYHKGVKEDIEDASMTFEELRIRKSEDFTDLEEGKRVSWSVEYCGIRKEIKDPKGTTIISMKETIERSREFLEALKKSKEKDPCCYVKPKVEMKTKGNAAYGRRRVGAPVSERVAGAGQHPQERERKSGKETRLHGPSRGGEVVKFPMDRPVKIVMLGAGGTGGYVAPYLFRLLHMLDRPARFVICDGDIVELKNLDRQNFVPADLGENKARILAERYSTVLGMETEYVPNFIETLPELMALIAPNLWETDGFRNRYAAEMVILLGCVDNNRTRQLCHEAFRQSEDLVYIDSGNGSYTGQVVCGVRRNGHTMRKPIGSVHPEMLRITDKFPSELSCAEAAQADPQSIVANVTAATAVLTMVYNILTHGENIALQTDFSTRTIRMQTVLEKQPRRKAA